MGKITDVFEGMYKLVMIPADIYVKVEKDAGTKALIATMTVGTWCAAKLLQIPIPEEFGLLAFSSASMYIGYSAHKAGVNTSNKK